MINYIIGIDAGGTSTKAIAFDSNMNIIAEAKTGCGSAAVVSEKAVWDNVITSIQMITEQIDDVNYKLAFMQIGLSAFSILNEVALHQNMLEKKYDVEVSIESDTMIALYSILKDKYENGIVAVAGTGVAIYGKNKEKYALIGGWGHIIRELGSAYACVHHLAITIIDNMENNIQLSTFQQGFLNFLKQENILSIKHLFYEKSKNEIANKVKYIKDFAMRSNLEAQRLLYEEGINLANQVIKAINKLDLIDNFAIGLRGGFVQNQNGDIIEGFKKTLNDKKIFCEMIIDDDAPIIGTYYLAKIKNKI